MQHRQFIILWLSILILLAPLQSVAQTQEDFTNKLAEVYNTTNDKKKAASIAKQLFEMLEKKKELQSYANYYLLKNIYLHPIGDTVQATICEEKAEKIMNASIGLQQEMPIDTSTVVMAWATYYFPALFTNADPDNASKALAYVNRNPELKSFTNYTYIAYAFERNNDFKKATEYYEIALHYAGDAKEVYHSYLYYTNFLTRTGDYLKADEYIRKMELLSTEANEFFRTGYKSEALSARVVYYLNIGDYQSYVKASEINYEFFSSQWHTNNKSSCDPYPGIRFTNAAFGKEMLKEYDAAEKLWKTRDSVNYTWVNCYNNTYPNSRYYPISMYPVYLIKRGKYKSLPKPVAYYIKETEEHYNSYKLYADLSAEAAKSTQLGFLGAAGYPKLFKAITDKIKTTRDFRESTTPFSNYAYFCMRDKNWDESKRIYAELFKINTGWINDIIFTFGEKLFVTFYNSKLKEGYDNFHSFVKIANENNPALFAEISGQAYNNLLFTKSISLQGTKKRKEVFLRSNDTIIHRLYDNWIGKKQQLIRLYMKTEDPSGTDTTNTEINRQQLSSMQQEVIKLENELTQQAKGFKKFLQITPPDWTTVRNQLQEGEASIEITRFHWRDQVYYSDTAYYAAYIITKKSNYPEVVYLPDLASELDDRFYKNYKKNILQKLNDNQSYNHYWKPIAEKLKGVSTVYVSPDGIYHLINLNTLQNPQTGKFLFEEVTILYTLSGSDSKRESRKNTAIETGVLIGRPAFKTKSVTSLPPADEMTRSFVRNLRDNNIPDLPGTEAEVLAIKKETTQNGIITKIYLQEQATEDKMYQLKNPGILHIATHGYWSPAGHHATEGYRIFNAMVNSGLLLAGVVNYYSADPYPNTYDGLLTAYEAQNLDLDNTALVVLSACETNLGYLDAGEGVYGLQRAFRIAGARNIITSLWKVDDNATKDFMITFYHYFLQSKNVQTAFIRAQQTSKEKYKSPYYWGAFVLMGE